MEACRPIALMKNGFAFGERHEFCPVFPEQCIIDHGLNLTADDRIRTPRLKSL
jgi:hypothetical protein